MTAACVQPQPIILDRCDWEGVLLRYSWHSLKNIQGKNSSTAVVWRCVLSVSLMPLEAGHSKHIAQRNQTQIETGSMSPQETVGWIYCALERGIKTPTQRRPIVVLTVLTKWQTNCWWPFHEVSCVRSGLCFQYRFPSRSAIVVQMVTSFTSRELN